MTAPSHSVTHYPSSSSTKSQRYTLSLSWLPSPFLLSWLSSLFEFKESERVGERAQKRFLSFILVLISISSPKPKMQKRRKPLKMASFLLPSITLSLFFFFFFSLSTVTSTSSVSKNPLLLLPSDAQALLSFKSSADLRNTLHFPINKKPFLHCQWVGVECSQGRVFRLILKGFSMEGGTFMANTLTRLDQLRVLSLQNNSLTGPIPDLSGLVNLKTLFLDHNSFSGFFPPSISSLHRLRTLDLSYNNLTGSIPTNVTGLDRIYYFKLEWNHFNGELPPLNQSSLQIFNVSGNNLTGGVPITVALSQFDASAFSWNPGLCGKIIHRDCNLPFFSSSPVSPPLPSELQQSQQRSSGMSFPQSTSYDKHRKPILILGFSLGTVILIGFLLGFLMIAIKKRRKQRVSNPSSIAYDPDAIAAAAVLGVEEENELEEKVKKIQRIQLGKSGSLMFCAGEIQIYSLEQLMRASAELIGRGSIGSTYKAVLDNQLIVSVKRLDAGKTSKTSKEMFENHMESVGSLRHPNLVPVRAYFQAKDEKLIIYDYQPNGSLFSLIHGSRSTKTKPLHWTSCLKIAEDVAQGLAYIHQASRLVHGNLKSTNVLLGPDFEACLTDYCLTALADSITDMDSNSSEYRAPEIRKSNFPTITSKSDVYSFGILLLELLTGKPASELRLMPTDLSNWRELEGDEENRLSMLLELATTCSQASPEQRPTMWEVMKMIQEIKECVVMEDNQLN